MGWTYGVLGETQVTASRANLEQGIDVRLTTDNLCNLGVIGQIMGKF